MKTGKLILGLLLLLLLITSIAPPTMACDTAALGVCTHTPNVNYLVQPIQQPIYQQQYVQQAYVSAAPVLQTVAVQNYAQAYTDCAQAQIAYTHSPAPVVQYQRQHYTQPYVQQQFVQQQYIRQPVVVQRQKFRQQIVVQRQKIRQPIVVQPVIQRQKVIVQRQKIVAPIARIRARNQVQTAVVY